MSAVICVARAMSFNRVAVLGLGRVGALTGTMLADLGLSVVGFDSRRPPPSCPYPVRSVDLGAQGSLGSTLSEFEAVVSCLPYHLNVGVASAAHQLGIHYFDLTEDVATTSAIREMSSSAKGIMAPQCGLAPGFVGIVGANLAQAFNPCRAIRMRVGALPRHPTGMLGYAFNWSPEGVVNEYLNDCEVIEDGVHKTVSPMEWLETLYVDGVKLEAFTTSGGLGTMCETFLGKIANLDYKTMRYPGHARLMNFFFHELLMREQRELAGKVLTHAKPPVDDDVVYVHVSAEGEIDGSLRRKEFVRAYHPVDIGGSPRTAIAWTTSASALAVIELVRDGKLPQKGFLKQEEIPLDAFLSTKMGRMFAGD
jgi:saccharopine dehydrogenase-like NADP-dependent oxidoreductase